MIWYVLEPVLKQNEHGFAEICGFRKVCEVGAPTPEKAIHLAKRKHFRKPIIQEESSWHSQQEQLVASSTGSKDSAPYRHKKFGRGISWKRNAIS